MESINSIYLENKKEGTIEWELQNPASNREIEGYLSLTSINAGDHIDLFVNTNSNKFNFSIYRMGWYAGKGARLISKSITLDGTSQKIPKPDIDTGLIECDWINPYNIKTRKDWVSGVYIGKLEELNKKKQSYVIFVVKNNKNTPGILFQLPVTTYQAYNSWGGKNLYEFGSGSIEKWGMAYGKRATKVSFNRPYYKSNNPNAANGIGAGDFFTNTRPVVPHNYPTSSAGWDYNMLRWLEKNNYNVGYITNIDTHNYPELLKEASIFMSMGHDEYWSKEMRANVTHIRDLGINLTFFSSNTMHWQIRFEKSYLTNKENRTIISYKETDLDPIKGDDATINFVDLPIQKSQATLIGLEFYLDPVKGDIVISNPNHWVFENTNLKKGSKLKGLLGYEIDGVCNESPKNIEVLAISKCWSAKTNNNKYIANFMFEKIYDIVCNNLLSKLKLTKKLNNYFFAGFCIILVILLMLLNNKLELPILLISGPLLIGALVTWFIKIKMSDPFISNMTYYKSEKGGQVFATGSMQWVWGLDNYNAPKLRKRLTSKEAQIITSNVLHRFGAERTKQ